MGLFTEVYKIEPVNDGYTYLCKNSLGTHYVRKKTENCDDDMLLFEHEELAEQYIKMYLDPKSYSVTYALYRNDCVPTCLISCDSGYVTMLEEQREIINKLKNELQDKETEIEKLLSMIDNLRDDLREHKTHEPQYFYNG